MACLNMLNNEQQGLYNAIGPRISFSSDFADPQQQIKKHENSYREAPVSSDFEFSVSSYSMISADELFSKGKLLPLKENGTKTLRDELLVDDDDDYAGVSPSFSKGMSRWKERFGLKKCPILPKKAEKNEASLENISETKAA